MHVTCSGPPPTCYFPSPNTLFHATISAISFQSPRFTVTGEGYIDVTTLNQPPEAYLFANLTIDGVTPFGLNGGGPFDTVNDPPHFDDLKGSTGPYQLTLFAIPDE